MPSITVKVSKRIRIFPPYVNLVKHTGYFLAGLPELPYGIGKVSSIGAAINKRAGRVKRYLSAVLENLP